MCVCVRVCVDVNVPRRSSDLGLFARQRWGVAVVFHRGQRVDHRAVLAEADYKDDHGQQEDEDDCH